MAGHHSQVLLNLQSKAERGNISEKAVRDFIIVASERGVLNNTNPESAYSRLASAYYVLGSTYYKKKQYAKALTSYEKALKAIQGSIDNDRLYYDTHRLKAVILMNQFCDLKGAEKELMVSLKILTTSKHNKAKRALPGLKKGALASLERNKRSYQFMNRCKARLNMMKQARKNQKK
jgi:tetratricopeptide (TPR) repeat protein